MLDWVEVRSLYNYLVYGCVADDQELAEVMRWVIALVLMLIICALGWYADDHFTG